MTFKQSLSPFLSSGGQSDSLRCSNRFLLPFGGLPRLGLWEGVLGHIAVPVSRTSVDGAFLNLVDFGSAPGRRTGNLGFFSPFYGFLNWSVVTSGAKAA